VTNNHTKRRNCTGTRPYPVLAQAREIPRSPALA